MSRPADPVALYDALNTASLAALLAEGGRDAEAQTALLEASLAAAGAFDPGTAQADALNVILAAVSEIRETGYS